MDSMVSRYRDRMMDSSSTQKALSASRQKSMTNQSNITPIPNIASTQSLKKSKNLIQIHTNYKEAITEEIQQKTNSQIPLMKGSVGQSMSLPPQPQNLSTNKKQKQKSNTNASNTTSNQPPLKSSRRINENQQKQKQKSKSKKVSRTPKKFIVITAQMLNESFGETILDVFLNDLKEKNFSVNMLHLINKEDLKQKVKLLLQEYFAKRLECLQKERVNGYGQEFQKSNRQMAQSHVIQQGYPSNILLTNDQASSLTHLPSTLSKTQLSMQKGLSSNMQKQLFETQKQRQYLQNKVQTLSKRIQNLTKDLQKYSKIQKLIGNTIEAQNESRREVTRLRKELEVSELKNSEQQKIWRKQVGEMRDVIMELHTQLAKSYEHKDRHY